MCSAVSFALGDGASTPKGAPKAPARWPQATTVVRSVGSLAALGRLCRKKSEGRGPPVMCVSGSRGYRSAIAMDGWGLTSLVVAGQMPRLTAGA